MNSSVRQHYDIFGKHIKFTEVDLECSTIKNAAKWFSCLDQSLLADILFSRIRRYSIETILYTQCEKDNMFVVFVYSSYPKMKREYFIASPSCFSSFLRNCENYIALSLCSWLKLGF